MDIDDRILHYLEAIAMELYNTNNPKSRFDRYVCAVASGNSTRHPDLMMDVAEISEWAIQLMLAADKRWEEYMKGGEDVR